MDYKKLCGGRLRDARKAKGLTLEQLSQRTKEDKGLYLSASRISNYEQGERQLGIPEALALYKHLGVKPAYLLYVDVDEEMTDQERELLRNFGALPENERAQYARRIAVLAMAYREPVADERLSEEVRQGAPRKRKVAPPSW